MSTPEEKKDAMLAAMRSAHETNQKLHADLQAARAELRRLKAEVEMLKQVIKHDTDKIEAAYADKLKVAVEALEKCKQSDGQAGIADADLFEQYFTYVEPQPMGTPKTIFRLGHAQGMAHVARLADKALTEIELTTEPKENK